MTETPENRAIRLVGTAAHVEAHYAADMGVHGSGKVVGYYDAPTFIIESAPGKRFAWLASLVREAPEPREAARPATQSDAEPEKAPEATPAAADATEADSARVERWAQAIADFHHGGVVHWDEVSDAYRNVFRAEARHVMSLTDADNEALRLEVGDWVNDQADKVARLADAEAEIERLREASSEASSTYAQWRDEQAAEIEGLTVDLNNAGHMWRTAVARAEAAESALADAQARERALREADAYPKAWLRARADRIEGAS